ncbi:PREDICTED: rho guanine nucleotide exchange factor 12-like [Thamnophis sirtalis]|uniref:Rho guanine nucleotide exchange factor 12-like n=1 Tax=Thamnophis sirtalis TaxID=35019 RepID=A0A6I9Y975_9SAUR|nr:PREDICTED: rho guanine nucleotide exchange factor 12-like [Thamnophis sirtalis]
MQQLGMSEQVSLEDWHPFSDHGRDLSGPLEENIVRRGLQYSDNNDTTLSGPGRTPMGTKTNDFELSCDKWPSNELVSPGDPVLHSRQLMDPLRTNAEPPAKELEGGGTSAADDGGEHFFDAQEAHSEGNPSEGGVVDGKEVEEVQLRISGNYLILDGYGTVQESSTDEEVTSLVLQCTADRSATDSAHQQPRSRDDQPVTASSPFAEELLASHWQAAKESSSDALRASFSVESRTLMMRYIQNIEASLQRLKEVEENYTALQHRLSGSITTDEHLDSAFKEKHKTTI